MIDSLYLFDSIALEADENDPATEKQSFLQKVKSFFSSIGGAISGSLKSVGDFFKNVFKKAEEKPKISSARWEAFKATLSKFNIFKSKAKKQAAAAVAAVNNAVNKQDTAPLEDFKDDASKEETALAISTDSTTDVQTVYDFLAMEAFSSPEFFEICLEAEVAGEEENAQVYIDPNEIKHGLSEFMSDLRDVIKDVWNATKKIESATTSAANKPGFVGKLKSFFSAITHPVRFLFSIAKRALSAAFAAVRSIMPMKKEEVPEKPDASGAKA